MVTSRSTDQLRGELLSAVAFELSAITGLNVHRGIPWVIQQDGDCFVHYAGNAGVDWNQSTLNSVAVWHRIMVEVFWKPPASGQLREDLDQTVWGAADSISQAIHGAETMGGLVDRIDTEPANAGAWVHYTGSVYLRLEQELRVLLFDSDAVAQ